MRLDDYLKRADELIDLADRSLATERLVNNHRFVDSEVFHEFRSSSLSFLRAAFGDDSTYSREFSKNVANPRPSDTRAGRGVLKAARAEMAGGWVHSAKGLVSAEIFADFMEMAQHLLQQDYKDAAAVIGGSVLEEHLRQLANRAAIPTATDKGQPRTADSLNADLAKNGLYTKLDVKSVTAWLDLRNKAAHGHYGDYTKEQVALMLRSIGDFMARVRP